MRYITAKTVWTAGVLFMLMVGCQNESSREPEPLDSESQQLLQQADQALREHQFERALTLVDRLEGRAPRSADVAFLRGRIYSELGRFEKAETAYRASLAVRPDYRGAWNNMANNAYRQQEYREAIRLYHRELEQHKAPVPWRGVGRSYVQLGKVDSARHAFKKALSIDPEHAPSYFSLGILYENEGEYELALQHVQKALDLKEDNIRYRYLLGSLLVSLNRSEEAVGPLRSVTQKWPWHNSAHYKLGQALVRLGRAEEGQQYLERAEKLREQEARITRLEKKVRSSPDEPYAHAALASALRMVGRYNDAMHAYRVALHLDPDNLEFRNNVALLHLLRGEEEMAINGFEHIVQQAPERVDAWVNLGVLYARSGHRTKAARAWQEALRHEPDHPKAQAYLARLNQAP